MAARIAEALRARPADEPLWPALRGAIETQFALGQQGHGGLRPPDEQWLAGIRLMMTEPALQGEVAKANAAVEQELADAIASRTGAGGMYPKLVAAAVGATAAVAMGEWLRSDPPVSMADLLSDALDQLQAGLPEPG